MPQLCEAKYCTGCSACHDACNHGAIEMQLDGEGFLYPHINKDACVECGLCERACHVLNPVAKSERVESPLAVIANDTEVVKKSSSGGVFSLLASRMIEQGGVVYGARYGEGFSVFHARAESDEELSALRGSKYVQSDTRGVFRSVRTALRAGREVLFVGTPCQVAALKTFLGRTDTTRLLTADLVCHGTPSHKNIRLFLQKYADKKKISVADIQDFRFRDFENWVYSSHFLVNGKWQVLPAKKNLFVSLYLGGYLNRPACYACPYATPERVGDITMADFWGIGRQKPFAHDTSHGCSLVLLNTPRGREAFEQIKSKVVAEPREWAEALAINTQLHKVSVCPKNRAEALHYLERASYDKTFNHFFNTPEQRIRLLIYRAKILLGLKKKK